VGEGGVEGLKGKRVMGRVKRRKKGEGERGLKG